MAQVGVNIRVILLLAIQIFTFTVWLQLLTSSKTFCRQERIVMIVFGARPTWKWISALKLISYDASHLNLGRLSWSYRIILWVKHTTNHSVWFRESSCGSNTTDYSVWYRGSSCGSNTLQNIVSGRLLHVWEVLVRFVIAQFQKVKIDGYTR